MGRVPVGDGWEVPADASPWSDFHWFSVPVRGSLRITVLSEKPTWYTGHYMRDRMIPCVGHGCEGCARGVGAQIRYAFAVADWETRRCGLLEVGRQNGLLLQDWMVRNGGFRGMAVDLCKQGSQRQSRTVLRYLEEEGTAWAMGLDVPEVGLALYLTWTKAGCVVPSALRERYEGRLSGGQSGRGGR